MGSFRLVITDEAETDIDDAFRWYQEQAGLGSDFLDALEERLRFIEHQPLALAEVSDGIRRSVVVRFPYHIYYMVNGRFIDILAVWHGSRDTVSLAMRVVDARKE
ncbi:MAG: type II toxin-antitoxin system RelE/ParE family toxin [Nevskia sp.]|nr:type II toxin-antitoxin system RelE/ParE family toxin [Nevskia sp.]